MEKNEDTDAIFVNMYCGQLPADKIAVVIREAYVKNYVSKPIVCRIKGTAANDANKILEEMNNPNIHCVSDFNEAALKVIELGEKERAKKLINF
jgi:succinyl-CoA synthetase beta subunit